MDPAIRAIEGGGGVRVEFDRGGGCAAGGRGTATRVASGARLVWGAGEVVESAVDEDACDPAGGEGEECEEHGGIGHGELRQRVM